MVITVEGHGPSNLRTVTYYGPVRTYRMVTVDYLVSAAINALVGYLAPQDNNAAHTNDNLSTEA